MVDKLNAFPYEITTPPVISFADVSMSHVTGFGFARSYLAGSLGAGWVSYNWSNIPAESLGAWQTSVFTAPAPATVLIEITPDNFTQAFARIDEGTTGSNFDLSVNLDVVANDLFAEIAIDFTGAPPTELTTTHTAGVFSTVISDTPSNQDYGVVTAHNDATVLAQLQALGTGKKALKYWFNSEGTGQVDFKIPNVVSFQNFDHRDNREAMPYLVGTNNCCDLDGLTEFYRVENYTPPDTTREYLYCIAFELNNKTGVKTLTSRNQTAGLPTAVMPLIQVSNDTLRCAWWRQISGTSFENCGVRTVSCLKNGYNYMIWYSNGNDYNDWIVLVNGVFVDFNFAGNIATVPAQDFAAPASLLLAINADESVTNPSSSLFEGKIHNQQHIDVTGLTNIRQLMVNISQQQSARNHITDLTRFILDNQFNALGAYDNQPPGGNTPKTITPFNAPPITTYL